MIYKSYKWCWAVHPSQQAKVNDPKAAVTMKIKAMKTTSWWRWWWWRWCWQCWRRWTTCIQAKGNDPCTKDCCCCGQLCTRTRLLSFTDFNAFFYFNHFQCGRSQTWEIFHRWQQNMSGTIFCTGTGTTFVSVEIKLGWSLSQICIAVMLLGGSSILCYPVVVVSVPMFQCCWESFWEAWVSQKKGPLLCITRQKLVSAGRGCSKQQGKCKLCSKPARQGKGRWSKLVALARQGWHQTESGPDGRPDTPWPSAAATRRLEQGGVRGGVGRRTVHMPTPPNQGCPRSTLAPK